MQVKRINPSRSIINRFSFLVLLFLLNCVPATEKDNCKSHGCSDTGLEILTVISCPLYLQLQNFDCKNFSPRYKSESQCIIELPGERNSALVGCAIGIQSRINLEKKSDEPFSGGVCIFNC
jgi:hypothetical protein